MDTVGKLIEALSKYDKEAPLNIQDDDGNFLYNIHNVDYADGEVKITLIEDDYYK